MSYSEPKPSRDTTQRDRYAQVVLRGGGSVKQPHEEGPVYAAAYGTLCRHGLTRREARIALLWAQGCSLWEIGKRLHDRQASVEADLRSAGEKLRERLARLRAADLATVIRAVAGIKDRYPQPDEDDPEARSLLPMDEVFALSAAEVRAREVVGRRTALLETVERVLA